MGRDHTIFAKEKGYVCYYKDPETHPKRKYIGVVFERGMKLPVPRNKPRNRRLGFVGREREMGTLATATPPRVSSGERDEELKVGDMTKQGGKSRQPNKRKRAKMLELKRMELRPGYQYRESNWHIGRAAERAQVKVKVREHKRSNGSQAWRKLNVRKRRNAVKKALSSRQNMGLKKGSKK